MTIMTIRRIARNEYDSNIAFLLSHDSGLCGLMLNSDLRLIAYLEICSYLINLFDNFGQFPYIKFLTCSFLFFLRNQKFHNSQATSTQFHRNFAKVSRYG